jgi:hypothetical protein
MGGHSLRRILDNAYSSIPGLWPLFGTKNKVNYSESRLITFFYSDADRKYSVVARNNDILKRLVLEAKREYEKDAEHRVHIFMADT